MRHSKELAIGGSVAFIIALLIISYYSEVGFNPYPQTTTFTATPTCASGASCPGFAIDGAGLSVNLYQDLTSQVLTVTITPLGGVALGRVAIFLDNVSLGVVEGPFSPGSASNVSAGVPTTITLTPGTTYHVVVEGFYLDPAGELTGTYWGSTSVRAG